jgi:hypothetical protein
MQHFGLALGFIELVLPQRMFIWIGLYLRKLHFCRSRGSGQQMYLAPYLRAWNGGVYYEVENLSAAGDQATAQEGATESKQETIAQETIAPQNDRTAGSDSDDGEDAQDDQNNMVVAGWVGSSFLQNDGRKTMKNVFWGIMSNGYVMHR